jgi:hypothetical protein
MYVKLYIERGTKISHAKAAGLIRFDTAAGTVGDIQLPADDQEAVRIADEIIEHTQELRRAALERLSDSNTFDVPVVGETPAPTA